MKEGEWPNGGMSLVARRSFVGSSSLSSAALALALAVAVAVAVIMAKTKSLFRPKATSWNEKEATPASAPYIFARLTLTAAIAEWSYAQSSAKLASLLALHDLLTSRPEA